MFGIIVFSPGRNRWDHLKCPRKKLHKKLSTLGLAFDANTAVPLKAEKEQEVQYKESKPPTLTLYLQVSLM